MTDEDRIAEAMHLAEMCELAFVGASRTGNIEHHKARRAALEAHLRAALAPAAPDLYAQIMNLPCKPPVDELRNRISLAWAYTLGHRDARHAAAELALARQPAQAVLCGCGDQIVPDDAAKCGVCAMQDAEDAARYRWLRDQMWAQALSTIYALPISWGGDYPGRAGESMDAAIDAARAPQEGSQP